VRRGANNPGFRPDAKAQVSVEYVDGRPKAIETVVVSQQHTDEIGDDMGRLVREQIIDPVLSEYAQYVQGPVTYHINPTGRFVRGGPAGDTGLTGRKIIVDTYGGMAPHGGGAFSGKDPTKVDRSAAYMARYVAKNVVAAGLADRCVLSLAYAIGVAQPVSVNLETFGTAKVDPVKIAKRISEAVDLSPQGITSRLDLFRQRYLPTAKNGHFGNAAFTWERTDLADVLKSGF
jgi:S-adenosylmethionine synthetase